jgi:acetyltransferase-like isoleucine patch superfamily enzyme
MRNEVVATEALSQVTLERVRFGSVPTSDVCRNKDASLCSFSESTCLICRHVVIGERCDVVVARDTAIADENIYTTNSICKTRHVFRGSRVHQRSARARLTNNLLRLDYAPIGELDGFPVVKLTE